MERLNKAIGQRLMKLRGGERTQAEVADALGVPRENLRNWENGTRPLKADMIIKLATYYNVSTDYLLGLHDIESPNADLQAVCKYTGLSEKAIESITALNRCSELFYMKEDYLTGDDLGSMIDTLDEFLSSNACWEFISQLRLVKEARIGVTQLLKNSSDLTAEELYANGNFAYFQRELKLSLYELSDISGRIADELYSTAEAKKVLAKIENSAIEAQVIKGEPFNRPKANISEGEHA